MQYLVSKAWNGPFPLLWVGWPPGYQMYSSCCLHGAIRRKQRSLDGLPGRQLAIDADMAAGAIDHAEAKSRREAELAETNFFGLVAQVVRARP